MPARNLERAELISENVLCLPIYPDLEFEQQKRIIKSIIDFQG
jgi:dTDP-4-amino-4,6-dideoxygalactose transaminase